MSELDGMWRRLVTTTTSMIAAVLTMAHRDPTAEGYGDEMVWVLLSISTGLQGSSTVNGIFMPLEKQAIYLMAIEKVMSNELLRFLQFLVRTLPPRMPCTPLSSCPSWAHLLSWAAYTLCIRRSCTFW
jgi:hypothetical protein